jgi:hypothetical protein
MSIDLQLIKSNVDLQSRSQNMKTLRRDTYHNTVKYLAFGYLGLIENTLIYVTNSKKVPKLPNKLPNEF